MFLFFPTFPKVRPSLKIHSSSFFNGSIPLIPEIHSLSSCPPSAPPLFFTIQAKQKLQGRVVCATNDKTVSVEVIRIVQHPKYKARMKKIKKHQAHDPNNQFKVGDFVHLLQCRPISKTKFFLAIPAPPRNAPKPAQPSLPSVLDLPFQSQEK